MFDGIHVLFDLMGRLLNMRHDLGCEAVEHGMIVSHARKGGNQVVRASVHDLLDAINDLRSRADKCAFLKLLQAGFAARLRRRLLRIVTVFEQKDREPRTFGDGVVIASNYRAVFAQDG